MPKYEFNITIIGAGPDLDQAFKNAIDSLTKDPDSTIVNEVIYVVQNNNESENTINKDNDCN